MATGTVVTQTQLATTCFLKSPFLKPTPTQVPNNDNTNDDSHIATTYNNTTTTTTTTTNHNNDKVILQ